MSNRTARPGILESSDIVEPELERLLTSRVDSQQQPRRPIDSAMVGSLIGFADAGLTPLVTYPGQPVSRALRARTTTNLCAGHVGREVVLLFEEGDPERPIVTGVIQDGSLQSLPTTHDHVEIDADGERLIVTAKEQIALRCGKSSIILTKDGKLLLQGAYVSTRSTGVLRLKAGSVQIN